MRSPVSCIFLDFYDDLQPPVVFLVYPCSWKGVFSTLQLQIDKQQPVDIEKSPSQHLLKEFLNYTLEVRDKVFVTSLFAFTVPCKANLILLALSCII